MIDRWIAWLKQWSIMRRTYVRRSWRQPGVTWPCVAAEFDVDNFHLSTQTCYTQHHQHHHLELCEPRTNKQTHRHTDKQASQYFATLPGQGEKNRCLGASGGQTYDWGRAPPPTTAPAQYWNSPLSKLSYLTSYNASDKLRAERPSWLFGAIYRMVGNHSLNAREQFSAYA